MSRTCLACASSQRSVIDEALISGEALRNIAKRVSISPAGLLRHKTHIATAIAKRQERLGDTRRVPEKAWKLLSRMEQEGDHRGAVVALREVRESLEALDSMMARVHGETGRITLNIVLDQRPRAVENPIIPRRDEALPLVPGPRRRRKISQ
jgi:hypothetical protein